VEEYDGETCCRRIKELEIDDVGEYKDQ